MERRKKIARYQLIISVSLSEFDGYPILESKLTKLNL